MSLPNWFEVLKSRMVPNTPSLAVEDEIQVMSALEIAWEALEKIYEGDPEGVYAGPNAKEAMRRIEELGK